MAERALGAGASHLQPTEGRRRMPPSPSSRMPPSPSSTMPPAAPPSSSGGHHRLNHLISPSREGEADADVSFTLSPMSDVAEAATVSSSAVQRSRGDASSSWDPAASPSEFTRRPLRTAMVATSGGIGRSPTTSQWMPHPLYEDTRRRQGQNRCEEDDDVHVDDYTRDPRGVAAAMHVRVPHPLPVQRPAGLVAAATLLPRPTVVRTDLFQGFQPSAGTSRDTREASLAFLDQLANR